jgi:hypothetical protein
LAKIIDFPSHTDGTEPLMALTSALFIDSFVLEEISVKACKASFPRRANLGSAFDVENKMMPRKFVDSVDE